MREGTTWTRENALEKSNDGPKLKVFTFSKVKFHPSTAANTSKDCCLKVRFRKYAEKRKTFDPIYFRMNIQQKFGVCGYHAEKDYLDMYKSNELFCVKFSRRVSGVLTERVGIRMRSRCKNN